MIRDLPDGDLRAAFYEFIDYLRGLSLDKKTLRKILNYLGNIENTYHDFERDMETIMEEELQETANESYQDGFACGILDTCEDCPRLRDGRTRPGPLCEIEGCHIAQYVVGKSLECE